jgi:hypothetical protein
MNQPFSPITRRQALGTLGCGFGMLATQALQATEKSPGKPHIFHHAPRAKRVIFLFMQGGVSHVDSFDWKPRLKSDDGLSYDFDDARALAKTGKGGTHKIMKPLWEFQQRGQSGLWVSELFPHMARHADNLCVIKSMHTEGVAHGPATLFLHTGTTSFVRPSMGAWVSYGLGTENNNLPDFVTISPSLGNGGPRNYGSGFLPAVHQGTPIGRSGLPAKDARVQNLVSTLPPAQTERQRQLIRSLNAEQIGQRPMDSTMEAVIQSYELAWRMQAEAPAVFDIADESPETLALYGIGEKATDNFGRQCLLARRMAESGVRFIQVNYGDNSNNPAWDQHSNLPKHADHALAVDQPVAGLLADLKRRGLLEDTLVWWGGEFGRTPYAEKNGTGRDHNPGGFSIWLAGGGVKAGHTHGETDEFGHKAVSDKVHMRDLHATILHLLGLDHEKLTFRHQGRDFRLTDVAGEVVTSLMASSS